MNQQATIGHNNPPDPIEDVIAEYAAIIDEAQNWTDGQLVENEGQMKAVDAILKEFKSYRTALTKAGKERTEPLHKAWKAEVAAVKVYTDDADMIQKALVAAVDPFKRKLAAEKAAKEREEWEKANAARKAAEEAARKANAADLDAQRELEAARQAAIDAENAAKAQAKDSVKGMRTVHKYSVEDYRAAVNWIAKNDKDAMRAFVDEYVRRNHKTTAIEGVNTWTEKEAF